MWSDSVVDPGLWNGTAWLDSGTFTAWRTPGPSLLGGLRDFHWNWNSRGRTVQNNTPCCGSRPPAYPSFYTDGHVFRRVKHRSSLLHRIDFARKYSLGAEMVDSSGTGFQSSETRGQSWILLGDRPSANPSFSTDGHAFTRVKHRSSLGHRVRSRWPPDLKTGVKMWNFVADVPHRRPTKNQRNEN